MSSDPVRYLLQTPEEMFNEALLRHHLTDEQRLMIREMLALYNRFNESVGVSPPPALPYWEA